MCWLFSDWNGATIAFMILGLICHLVAFVFTIVTTVCRKGHPFPSFLIGGLFVVAGTNKRFHLQDSICYFAFQVVDLLDCEQTYFWLFFHSAKRCFEHLAQNKSQKSICVRRLMVCLSNVECTSSEIIAAV